MNPLTFEQKIFLLKCYAISMSIGVSDRGIWEDREAFDRRHSKRITYNDGNRNSVFLYIVDVLVDEHYSSIHADEFNLMGERFPKWKKTISPNTYDELIRIKEKWERNLRAVDEPWKNATQLAIKHWDLIYP